MRMSKTDAEVKCRIVEKLLRNEVIGKHTLPVSAAADRYLASHNVGRGRDLIEDEMIPQNEAGIEMVGGGARNTIRIGDVEKAVSFLEDNDGNPPFGL